MTRKERREEHVKEYCIKNGIETDPSKRALARKEILDDMMSIGGFSYEYLKKIIYPPHIEAQYLIYLQEQRNDKIDNIIDDPHPPQ